MVWFPPSTISLCTQSTYKEDLSCKSPTEANKCEDEQLSNPVSVVQNAMKKEKQKEVECPDVEKNKIYILQGQKVDKGKKEK